MRRWRLWLGLIISGAFLYLALRGLSLDQVLKALRGANYWWLLPGIAVYFLAVWARTWRWHYLLRPLKPIPLRTLFPVVAIGYMGNNIYPARAGELLRAYILKRQERVSISANLATVVVERIFDGLVMLLFVFVTLPISGLGGKYQVLVTTFSLLFFGALLLFMVMAVRPEWFKRLLALLLGLVPSRFHGPAHETLDRFLEGLESLRSGRAVLMIFLSSVVVWLLETVKYWLVMHAFPFEVSFYVLMLMNGVVNLFTTLPAAPGYVGTFDLPGIEILQRFGVPHDVATGYTLVLHAALWFPITAVGAFYLWRARLSWAQVQADLQGDEEARELDLVSDDEALGKVWNEPSGVAGI
ncbi:MAG TPA: TIGR00374 family protein [Chloroflexi bacterium]|nr:TIGR00374 family protein [Chloroflexota bacterium]